VGSGTTTVAVGGTATIASGSKHPLNTKTARDSSTNTRAKSFLTAVDLLTLLIEIPINYCLAP
jgi:hypothetical protein